MRRDDEYYVISLQYSGGWRISEHESSSERRCSVILHGGTTRRVHEVRGHVTVAQQVFETTEDIARTFLGAIVSCAVQTEGHLTACQELFDEFFVEVDLLFHGLLLLLVLAVLVLQHG